MSSIAEVTTAAPYAALPRADFDATIDFVATGGYALQILRALRQDQARRKDGTWRIAHPRVAQQYRMNVGTIVEADMVKVRLVRSRAAKVIPRGGAALLGQVEEYFIETLSARRHVRLRRRGARNTRRWSRTRPTSRARNDADPKVPSYEGGKFPLSTYLADRVRGILADHHDLARAARPGARLARGAGMSLPAAGRRELCWSRRFRAPRRYYLVCYPFEGRLAHQTLGMLLTRRLERARMRPLGFVANEYALAVWGLRDVAFAVERGELSLDALFDEDMLGDDLEAWLAEVRADEAHLPQLRDHRRADRAAFPGRGEEPAAR